MPLCCKQLEVGGESEKSKLLHAPFAIREVSEKTSISTTTLKHMGTDGKMTLTEVNFCWRQKCFERKY